LPDGHPGLGTGRPLRRVDVDALHKGEVDHQPPVGYGFAGDVVAAAADRDLESLPPAEVDRVHDIRRVETSRDDRWTLVDQAVVDSPGLVVAGIARSQDLTGERLPKQLD